MLIESTVHLPVSLAMLDGFLNWPGGDALPRVLLRWAHFVAGVTWIGLLYFFNLVNVPFQKTIDADTKKKVNPKLLGDALWYFRWGALVTVLVGFTYYAMYIMSKDSLERELSGFGSWFLDSSFKVSLGVGSPASALPQEAFTCAPKTIVSCATDNDCGTGYVCLQPQHLAGLKEK